MKACVWLLLPLLLLFLLRYRISLQNYEFDCIRSDQIHLLAPHKNRFFISLWTLELFEASLSNRTYSCNYCVLTEHVFRTLLPQKTLSGLGKDQGTLYLIIWNGPWILESHFNVNEHWHKCVNGPLSGIPKWKRDSKQPVHFDNVQPKNVFHFGVIINIWNASQQHVLIISLNMRLFLRILDTVVSRMLCENFWEIVLVGIAWFEIQMNYHFSPGCCCFKSHRKRPIIFKTFALTLPGSFRLWFKVLRSSQHCTFVEIELFMPVVDVTVFGLSICN